MFPCILSADVDTITILQNKSKNITSSFFTVPVDAKKNIKKLQKLLWKLLTKKQKYYKMVIVPKGTKK